MYKCADCGKVFSEPVDYAEDLTPGGAFEGGSFVQHQEVCPYCNGTSKATMKCASCDDEYIFIDSEYPFCDNCIDRLVTQYKNLMLFNFREDEYDMLVDHIDSISPYHEIKKED